MEKILKSNKNKRSRRSSSSAFFALTLLNPGSQLKIKNVGLNPTRPGFYNL